MRPHHLLLVLLLLLSPQMEAAEPDFPLTADSKPQPDVPKGEMIKGSFVSGKNVNVQAPEDMAVYPGTEREYQVYIPHGLDRSKPAAFMVFQDGVIYQAPVVFDNLIAKKDIPPLVGIFVKPGVVPPPNENALPRFNRSFEYDSISDSYARFLLSELLPAIEKEHGLKLSTDPNDAAIAGNSSGGIAAFMVAWHRPDRFRRVFTGVGTYVGIHGGDRLPVLVRKLEPKPIRIFLQSGTGDNNLYCGDWWMANQMMERSFTWAGYDVNHAWGEGGHNQKHASQIFPDVLRWLWRDWQTNKEIKANAKGESKWKGYEVCETGKGWETVAGDMERASSLATNRSGDVFAVDSGKGELWKISGSQPGQRIGSGFAEGDHGRTIDSLVVAPNGKLLATGLGNRTGMSIVSAQGKLTPLWTSSGMQGWSPCMSNDGWIYLCRPFDKEIAIFPYTETESEVREPLRTFINVEPHHATMSPDQTQIYVTSDEERHVQAFKITSKHELESEQAYFELEMDEVGKIRAAGLCVDTDGRLYVATSFGIQVCDQAGRVNFIIPTPERPHDVCFGGKELSELFVACGSKVYKRSTKVHGIVSSQMPPIKPAAPKL